MLYYSHEARQSAIKNINKCIAAIYDTTEDELKAKVYDVHNN